MRLLALLSLAGASFAYRSRDVRVITECHNSPPYDLSILVDGSYSISDRDFGVASDVVSTLIDGVNLDTAKVSLSQFSTEYFQYVDRSNDARAIDAAVRELKADQKKGGTRTGNALEQVLNEVLSQTSRRKQILLVITDGNPTDLTSEPSKGLKDADVQIFAIGVGNDVDEGELQDIASSPSDKHVFKVNNFNELLYKIAEFQKQICTEIEIYRCPCENGEGPEKTYRCYENECERCNQGYNLQNNICVPERVYCDAAIDATFVIDGSSSVGYSGWDNAMGFIKDISGYIHVEPSRSHFSVIQYSDNVVTHIEDSSSAYQLSDLKRLVRYKAGPMTNTASGLRHANNLISRTMRASRKSVAQQQVLILTDGESHESAREISQAANELKANGYTVWAVGVGPNEGLFRDQLREIASSDDTLFHADKYPNLPQIARRLSQALCDTVRPTPCRCQHGEAASDYNCIQEKCLPDGCDRGYTFNDLLQICVEDRSEICEDRTFDFYILFDSSSSIDPVDFKKGVQFIQNQVSRFNFGPSASRITVGQYAYPYESELPETHRDVDYYCQWSDFVYPNNGKCQRRYTLTQADNKHFISSKLYEMQQIRGGTFTGSAMETMCNVMQNSGRTHHTKKIMLVVTDGATHQSDVPTLNRASYNCQDLATVVSIGVGRSVNEEELKTIASRKPEGGKYMFRVENYDQLANQVAKTLSDKLCIERPPAPVQCQCANGYGKMSNVRDQARECRNYPCTHCYRGYKLNYNGQCVKQCTSRKVELVFAVDLSNALEVISIEKAKEFMRNVVNNRDFNIGPGQSDVTIMTFGQYSNFLVKRSTDVRELNSKIDSIKYQRGICTYCRHDNAIDDITNHLRRSSNNKDTTITVVLTGGCDKAFYNDRHLESSVRALKQETTTVAAIGLSYNYSMQNLKQIATYPYMFGVLKSSDWQKLEAQMAKSISTEKC